MAPIPNLYLKWRALRELIGMPLSDAQIGAAIFGEGREGAPKFSKLLYGDYGCSPEIGTELAAIINKRVSRYRQARGLAAGDSDEFVAADLSWPLQSFTRKLIEAAGDIDSEAIERAQEALLQELAPASGTSGAAHLVVERYDNDRSFAGFLPSGGSGPIVFQAGKHTGRLAVLGIERAPAMAYTLLARDPRPVGQRLWDLDWREMVLWLPSPSAPALVDGALLLMPQAAPVSPVPGRFLATTVLVWDGAIRDALDPRSATAKPGALDEMETSRFFTNLRRVERRTPEAVSCFSAEYIVVV